MQLCDVVRLNAARVAPKPVSHPRRPAGARRAHQPRPPPRRARERGTLGASTAVGSSRGRVAGSQTPKALGPARTPLTGDGGAAAEAGASRAGGREEGKGDRGARALLPRVGGPAAAAAAPRHVSARSCCRQGTLPLGARRAPRPPPSSFLDLLKETMFGGRGSEGGDGPLSRNAV